MADLTGGDNTPIMRPTSDENTPLMGVIEGMNVYDSDGNRIGTVRRLRMGGNDPVDAMRQSNEAVGPRNTDDPGLGADLGDYATTLIEDVGDTFTTDGDDLPEEERENLLNKGYIQIDSSGFFTADRFATAEQIARVEGDNVYLNVDRDALVASR